MTEKLTERPTEQWSRFFWEQQGKSLLVCLRDAGRSKSGSALYDLALVEDPADAQAEFDAYKRYASSEEVRLHFRKAPDKPGPGEGHKYSSDKIDWTLIPWDGLEEVAKVLEYGAKRYARENWRDVPNSTFEYTKAAFRHLIAMARGETHDPESGLLHAAHLACCAIFLCGRRNKP